MSSDGQESSAFWGLERPSTGVSAGLSPPLPGKATRISSWLEPMWRCAGCDNHNRSWILGEEIGAGGMGTVYKLWDERLRRTLVMKVSRESVSSTRDLSGLRAFHRFVEEAQITGQLEHPGVVPIHEIGLDPQGHPYFTMQLVRGRDFGALIAEVHAQQGRERMTRAVRVLAKVCETVSFAHSKGIVHRDLKPSNVMVGRFGEVYVMDWGLARVLRPEERNSPGRKPPSSVEIHSDLHDRGDDVRDADLLTRNGDVLGTPAYMPPEQALGLRRAVGPRSDVYSVGAMLYHLLAGHPPYLPPGSPLTSGELLARVRTSPPEPLRERGLRGLPELVAMCEKAMHRDADQRYGEMSEMGEELLSFLENRAWRRRRGGAWAAFRRRLSWSRGSSSA